MLVAGWTSLSFSCLNSSCYRFNKVLETLLRNTGPRWYEGITIAEDIFGLHIHHVNLPIHHIPKVLDSIEIMETI